MPFFSELEQCPEVVAGWNRIGYFADKPDGINDYYSAYFPYPRINGMPTSRRLEDVAGEHDYSLNDFVTLFKGKNVLDIGAGYSTLETDLDEMGIGSFVVRLDLPRTFYDPIHCGIRTDKEVIAFAQHLPFNNESFDTVVSTYGPTMYNLQPGNIIDLLAESLRVVKPGGIILFSPFHLAGEGISYIKNALDYLDSQEELLVMPWVGKHSVLRIHKTEISTAHIGLRDVVDPAIFSGSPLQV